MAFDIKKRKLTDPKCELSYAQDWDQTKRLYHSGEPSLDIRSLGSDTLVIENNEVVLEFLDLEFFVNKCLQLEWIVSRDESTDPWDSFLFNK
jgi:hypothetical protein